MSQVFGCPVWVTLERPDFHKVLSTCPWKSVRFQVFQVGRPKTRNTPNYKLLLKVFAQILQPFQFKFINFSAKKKFSSSLFHGLRKLCTLVGFPKLFRNISNASRHCTQKRDYHLIWPSLLWDLNIFTGILLQGIQCNSCLNFQDILLLRW